MVYTSTAESCQTNICDRIFVVTLGKLLYTLSQTAEYFYLIFLMLLLAVFACCYHSAPTDGLLEYIVQDFFFFLLKRLWKSSLI